MAIPKAPLIAAILRYAGGLKFKNLFLITGGLFLFTLLIPDPFPFADELLLGLLTLLFSMWKNSDQEEPGESAENDYIEGEVVDEESNKRD